MEAKRSPDSAEKNDPREDGGPTLVFEKEGHIVFETPASSLAKHPITIGRDKECDWCTAGIDGSISSRHAEIYRRHGAVRIRDLGSRNGIFAKGERVKECRVTIGDPILIGACKLSLEPPRKAGGSLKSEHHRLEQLNGPNAGRVLEIVEEKDIVIGSDPASGIFIADTLVSRKHAKLSFKKNECWLSDLGSRNGTSVNGVAVTKERLLRDGDVISVAYVEFRFYDKDVAHVDAHVGKTLFIAAATVGFGILGFSFWNLMRPEAGRLLYKAETAASSWTPKSQPEDFARAFAYLDEAAVARAADKHATALAEQKSRMESWTNTITGWQEVQKKLLGKKWIDARGKFHTLTSWTWPSQSAAKAHHEADAVQELVNTFLDSRSDIRSEEFQPAEIAMRFRADATALDAALKEAPTEEERKYIEPLRFEALELLAEFRHAIAVLDSIPQVAETLNTAGRKPPSQNAASDALATLRRLLEEEKKHEQDRRDEAKERKIPHPYFSPLVSARVAAALSPLEALASGERQVLANIDAIAAADWDSVKRELQLPERSVTDVLPAYQKYRDWLVAENAQFCGTAQNPFAGVDTVFKTAIESLERRGFGSDLSKTPEALASLLDPATIAEALRFIDPDADPIPDALDTQPVCAYDRFIGLKAFAEFLGAIAEAEPSSADGTIDYGALQNAVNGYVAAADRLPWRPLVAEARGLQGHLRTFLRRPDEVMSVHPDSSYAGPILSRPARMVVDARPSGAPNRCVAALSNAAAAMRRIEDWKSEDLLDAAEDAGTVRSGMLADGVALIMADPKELASARMRRIATELGSKARDLKKELKKIDARAETSDPWAVRREIVSKGIPAISPPFIGAWRNLRNRKAEETQW